MNQTLNSRFYYPLSIYRGTNEYKVDAPFVSDLGDPFNSTVVVLSVDRGAADQGMYVKVDDQWKFALPMVEVSAGVIIGYTITVYYKLTTAVTIDDGSAIYKNGAKVSTTVLQPTNDVYTVLTPITAGLGGVSTVNNIGPDVNGNVSLPNVMELSISLPFVPSVDETVFYQQLPKCEYVSANAIVDAVNTEVMRFPIKLDGVDAGYIQYTAGAGVVHFTATAINAHQILSIDAPPAFDELVGMFAFTFTFKRL